MSASERCFIPGCTNTRKNNPTKVFITVPKDAKKKRKWFAAARRNIKYISPKTVFRCCEDHFNLEEDMENYWEFKLSKVHARMKNDVVPHIFTFSQKGRPTSSKKTRVASENRAKKRKIAEIIESYTSPNSSEPQASTSTAFDLPSSGSGESGVPIKENLRKFRDVASQTEKTRFRSKAIQVSVQQRNQATSPIKLPSKKKSKTLLRFGTESGDVASTSGSCIWQPSPISANTTTTSSSDEKEEVKRIKQEKED